MISTLYKEDILSFSRKNEDAGGLAGGKRRTFLRGELARVKPKVVENRRDPLACHFSGKA